MAPGRFAARPLLAPRYEAHAAYASRRAFGKGRTGGVAVERAGAHDHGDKCRKRARERATLVLEVERAGHSFFSGGSPFLSNPSLSLV